MILRGLASLALIGLFVLNLMMPSSAMLVRGNDLQVRADKTSRLMIGERLPELSLVGFDGSEYTREDLLGHRVLLTFERSVDW
jgi:hypothetical protein